MAKRNEQPTQNNKIMLNLVESVINTDDYRAEVSSPLDYMGKPVIIFGFDNRKGQQGDYVHIEALDVNREIPVIISTGGTLIMRALNDIQAKGGFPVLTTFGKSGNAYVFKPVQVSRHIDLGQMVSDYMFGQQAELPYVGQDFPES